MVTEAERARLMPEAKVRALWASAQAEDRDVRRAIGKLSEHFWVTRRVVEKRLVDLGLLAPENASYKG